MPDTLTDIERAVVDELLDALAPFAADARGIDPSWADERRRATLSGGPKVSDLRHAREVYERISSARRSQEQEAPRSELLPCPFCGGEAVWSRDVSTHEADAMCTVCGALVSESGLEAVIAQWNTRVPCIPPAEPTGKFTDADAAKVGRSLMAAIDANRDHPLIKDWTPAEDPAEIVADLLDAYDTKAQPSTPKQDIPTDEEINAWMREMRPASYPVLVRAAISQFSPIREISDEEISQLWAEVTCSMAAPAIDVRKFSRRLLNKYCAPAKHSYMTNQLLTKLYSLAKTRAPEQFLTDARVALEQSSR